MLGAVFLTSRRGFWQPDAGLLWLLLRITLAALVMALALLLIKLMFVDVFGTQRASRKMPAMAILILAGGATYLVASIFLRSVPPSAIAALRRFRGRSG